MRYYQAPIDQFKQLITIFNYNHVEYDPQTIESLLLGVSDWVEKKLPDTNQDGDDMGAQFDQGQIILPPSFHEAYSEMSSNGIFSLGMPIEWGGLGAPPIVMNMLMEMLSSGNLSLSTCHLLSSGVIRVLDAFADQELKNRYLNALVEGNSSGVMCLTEPQCGTDLGLISTRATPVNHHYEITGHKIWISFGEHQLTDNIIHLVLAKLPDAPEGSRGISLFLVPKYLEGGQKNGVVCTGIEKKMGTHGAPTCFMSYEGAVGYLIGEPHQGLPLMFQMMNEARLAVGVQALGVAEIAYQAALKFADERRQSRALQKEQRDMSQKADLIRVHPDIKRMLNNINSQLIAMRALVAFTAIKVEQGHPGWVGHLTPIVKSFLTERCVDMVSEAMQVMGGMGYVKDGAVEQYLRDLRVTMIYEGTNGIQALDLVGRKLLKDQGKTVKAFIELLQNFDCPDELFQALMNEHAHQIEQCLVWLGMNGIKNPNLAAASASDFLRLMGISLLSYMWAHYVKQGVYLKEAAYFRLMIAPEAKVFALRVQAGQWVI